MVHICVFVSEVLLLGVSVGFPVIVQLSLIIGSCVNIFNIVYTSEPAMASY